MAFLLDDDEMPAVIVRETDGPLVVVCEHASNRMPRRLGSLGLDPRHLERHIAWDPGALSVAEAMAEALGATLVFQRYSRLAIDCNRDPSLPDAITTYSEDTAIPGNDGLTPEMRSARIDEIWTPFHDAIERLTTERLRTSRPTALVTVHSFTPVYRGVTRPWHVGIISTDERGLAEKMLTSLRSEQRLVVGDNEPYSSKDNVDYTIRRHGRDRGVPHAMVEIRNDLLSAPDGCSEWAERLARLLGSVDLFAKAA